MEEQKVHNQAMAKVFTGANFVLFQRICTHTCNCLGIIQSYPVNEVYSLMAHTRVCRPKPRYVVQLFFPTITSRLLNCALSLQFFAKALLPNVLDVCLVLRVLLLAVVCFFILETLGLSIKEV